MESVDTLPTAAFWLVPELVRHGYPAEKLSDCSHCAMEAPDPVTHRPQFTSGVRCCTYAPEIMNFSVGRILRDGGEGATRIRDLLLRGQPAVGSLKPPKPLVAAYQSRQTEAYGRDASLRCPYFQEGEHGCSIWAHRNHVCRTWFCRHVDGVHGLAFWTAVSRVLQRVEHLLAAFCVADGRPPRSQRVRKKQWEKWYLWCAERVDRLEVVDLQRLEDDAVLAARRAQLADARAAMSAEIPDVLGASVSAVKPVDGAVVLTGYSPFQPARVPEEIFQVLAALDGRPWRDALKAGSSVTETDLLNLYRIGAVSAWGDAHRSLPSEPVSEEGC